MIIEFSVNKRMFGFAMNVGKVGKRLGGCWYFELQFGPLYIRGDFTGREQFNINV